MSHFLAPSSASLLSVAPVKQLPLYQYIHPTLFTPHNSTCKNVFLLGTLFSQSSFSHPYSTITITVSTPLHPPPPGDSTCNICQGNIYH